jgi:hypothetical protein
MFALGAVEFYAGRIFVARQIFADVETDAKQDGDIHLERGALKWLATIMLLTKGESTEASQLLHAARAVDLVTSANSAAGLDHALDICNCMADFISTGNAVGVSSLGEQVFAPDSRIHTHPALEWQDTTELFVLVYLLLQACLSFTTPESRGSATFESLLCSTRQAAGMLNLWSDRFRLARPLDRFVDAALWWIEITADIASSDKDQTFRRLNECTQRMKAATSELEKSGYLFIMTLAQVWLSHMLQSVNKLITSHPSVSTPSTHERAKISSDIAHHLPLTRYLCSQHEMQFNHPFFRAGLHLN